MATITVKLFQHQNQIQNNYFSYRILKNNIPLVYTSGATTVHKTFKNYVSTPTGRINKVNLSNVKDVTFDTDPAFNGTVNSIAPITISGQQKYVVGGDFTMYQGATANRIIILNEDGTVYSGFTPPAFNGKVTKVFVDSNNKIVIGGDFSNFGAKLTRLLTNGSIDSTWVQGQGHNGLVYDIVELSTGKYVIGGSFTTYTNNTGTVITVNRIMRLNSNGSYDSTSAFEIGCNGDVNAIKVLSGDKLLIAGAFTTYRYNTEKGIVKTNADCTKDFSFDNSNLTNGIVYSIDIQSSGDIIIGGEFTNLKGSLRNNLGRVSASGTLDTAFVFNCNGNVKKVYVDPTSNSIYVGGNFTEINGLAFNRLCRLYPTVGIDTTFVPRGYDSTVTTVKRVGSSIIVGGAFSNYDGGVATQTVDVIPIGLTEGDTLENIITNLNTYNSNPEVTYTTDGLNQVFATINMEAGATYLIDNIVDKTSYFTVNLSNDTYGVSPIIIQSRSPHFVNIPCSNDTTSCKFELKIYKGNYITDAPTLPTYSMTKSKITANQDSFYIDVAQLCRDFLSTSIDDFINDSNTAIMDNVGINETTWMALDYTLYIGEIVENTGSVKYLVTDGFGYVEEGVNPQPQRVFLTSDTAEIYRGGIDRLYFITSGLDGIIYQGQNETSSMSVSFTGSTLDSNSYISSLKIANYIGSDYIDYSFSYNSGTLVINKRFYYKEECKYEVKELYFKNKDGFLQSIPFFKRSNKEYSVEGQTYKRSILTSNATFNPKKHSTITYNIKGEETITLNSGYIKESMNESFKQLFLSDEIYLMDNFTVRPVTLVDKSLSTKTVLNDKLIDYTIKVKLAHNVINTIR